MYKPLFLEPLTAATLFFGVGESHGQGFRR
jgi:hypothetical protein